jgi:hypothetical protein
MPAITTLADLKAACADALVRSDFTDRIAAAVPLAEAWLNRNLRLRAMQTEIELTTTPGARTVALPAGFLEPLALFLLEGGRRVALPYRPDLGDLGAGAALPASWNVVGEAIVFPVASDAAYPLILRMLQRFALAGEDDSNALLDAWPDLYLAALLVTVAGVYLTDDPRLSAWKFSRDELLAEALRKEARAGALATLAVEPAFGGRRACL